VEEIREDGTVVFTEKSRQIMKNLMGYDAKELQLADVDERARELMDIYRKLAQKHNAPYSVY
jgi:hypothetical protein